MDNKEVEKVLKELEEVQPEKLNNKAKRLFEAIMTISNQRDEAWSKLKNSIPKKTYNQTKKTLKGIIAQKESDLYEANNRINDLLDIDTQKDKLIDEMVKVIIDSEICKKYIKNHCIHYAGENNKLCDECILEYFEERCK